MAKSAPKRRRTQSPPKMMATWDAKVGARAAWFLFRALWLCGLGFGGLGVWGFRVDLGFRVGVQGLC